MTYFENKEKATMLSTEDDYLIKACNLNSIVLTKILSDFYWAWLCFIADCFVGFIDVEVSEIYASGNEKSRLLSKNQLERKEF